MTNEYFEWLVGFVDDVFSSKSTSTHKLLLHLHSTIFRYSIPRDSNRAQDGLDLRYRFCSSMGYDEMDWEYLDDILGPCTVLEMMIALAINCEEEIMDDPLYGNRTSQWFWGMISSLGLGGMVDDKYDSDYVEMVLQRFLDREYDRDGRGGLFTVRGRQEDLRDAEIWYQLNWYLDTIT